VMDRWILSRMNGNIQAMTEQGYEAYDTPQVVGQAWIFMRDLSLWYVRRIRDRVGPSVANGEDKNAVYQTLWTVLTEYCKALAPLIPFVTEEMYRNLTGKESIHLESWPEAGTMDAELEKNMELVRRIVEKAHASRKEKKIKVRMPLSTLTYTAERALSKDLEAVIAAETNVKKVAFTPAKEKEEFPSVTLDFTETDALKKEGQARDLVREIQELRKAKACSIDAKIKIVLPEKNKELSSDLIAYIQKETLGSTISWGETLTISTG